MFVCFSTFSAAVILISFGFRAEDMLLEGFLIKPGLKCTTRGIETRVKASL